MFKTSLINLIVTSILLVSGLTSASAQTPDVVVAKDGTGNFTTVQAAINAAPTGRITPYIIYIKNGKYREKDTIPSNKPFIQLIGQSVANVTISWDDYNGKPIPGGGVYGTGNSATVTVAAADFTAINITFENTTGETPQALAINVTGDRAAFKNCRFLGGQDTVFAGGNGARQYYRNCYIDGTVDFIFGDARAVFDTCIIYAKTRIAAGQSYITAANTKQTEPYGYVFRDCKIPTNRGSTVYFLGRPWQNDAVTADAAKSYNKTIFLNTTMSSSIQPAGWSIWDAGTDVSKITYAEYKSRKFDGTLIDISNRVSWSKQLTDAEAANYYNNTTLFGTWDPCTVYTEFCANNQREIAVSNFKGVKGTSISTFTWNISWPIAQVQYEVLRSNDRVTFNPVNSQVSPNDSNVNYNYAEAVPPPGITYYYLIRASKTGYATHISDTVTISSTPTINVTGAMGSFVQGVGTPSTSQSYVVSASSLTNNLIITAPANYELSTNGGTNWNTSSNPIVLTPDANGNVPNTTISVRLNASSAGTYNGNIVHSSTGAVDVNLAVTGTVQAGPLSVSEILEWWPMSLNNADSAAVRSPGILPTTPTLNKLYLSNGTTVPSVPAYSGLHGQAFSPTANGDGTWTTAAGGPGGNLNRTFYEQFIITASATHSLRVDSFLLSSSFYNTNSNTKLAVVYSMSGFTTDSADVTGGVGPGGQLAAGANGGFATPVLLNNETAGNTSRYRFALAGGAGITLASSQTLTLRLYFSCGSGSNGRYAKVKDVQVKGLPTPNPTTGDYRSHQSGNWIDVNSWERWDGTTWVYPAPAFPHFSNANSATILNGHTITHAANFSEGSGYIPTNTKINVGGQLIVNNGATLNVPNNGTPAVTNPDLTVDGALTLFGAMGSNSNVHVIINGSFVNSGTSLNLSNTGDTVTVGPNGNYTHNVSLNNTPLRTTWQPGSTLLVTGITGGNQTGFFRSTTKYANIVWNNTTQTNYYAFRATLDSSNVQGRFTVQSTGSTYIAFANANGQVTFPGGFYQTGGTVNFRESGTVTDTLTLGGDFSITGGTFNSNSAAGTSLLIRLNGINKTIIYSQNGGTNTNWEVNGIYSLGANLQVPTATFGVKVNGTLNLSTYTITGAGNFTLSAGGILTSGSPTGLEGNLTLAGTKTFSPSSHFILNGTSAQVTGSLFPATINAFTINNTSDVTLTNNLDVTGALTLTNGRLIIGNNNITVSSILSASSTKYVVTNGTGMVKIRNIAAGGMQFPIGPNTSSYNPAGLDNSGTTDNFSVNVKTTFDYPVPDPNKVVNRQWTITEDVVGGSNVKVSLSWLAADQAAGFDPAGGVAIMRYDGTNWISTAATVTGAGTLADPYVATANGFTSFSPFIVSNMSAVPVTLLSFNAGFNGNVITIVWKTTNEFNVALYEVERSFDAMNFTTIGSLPARNLSSELVYSLDDANASASVNYYRLKTTDRDGTIKYSKVILVNGKTKGITSIYPNPATSVITLTHERAAANSFVQIISADGTRMKSELLTEGSTQSTISVNNLPAGIYNLVIKNGEKVHTIKLIKQ